MIAIRILVIIGILYLSWEVLPTVVEIILYPLVAGGKNVWVFDVSKWIALFVGVIISGVVWERIELDKKFGYYSLLFVSILIICLQVYRYNKVQSRIMGYEPVEATKNVILSFDPEAKTDSFSFDEIKRYTPENKSNTIVLGEEVKFDVKRGGKTIYKVSVYKVNDWWEMRSFQRINN